MALFFIVFVVAELILTIDIERRYVKQKRLIDSNIHDCRFAQRTERAQEGAGDYQMR